MANEPSQPAMFLCHKSSVRDVTFSPESRILLTASNDNTAQLWSVPDGKPLFRPLDLHRPIRLVAFAPDGRSVATQDGDLIRLWRLPEEGVPIVPVPLDGKSSFAALSPDGALTISTGMSFTPTRTLRSTRAYRLCSAHANGRPSPAAARRAGFSASAPTACPGTSMAVG